MRGITPFLPTLFSVATHADDFTYEDVNSFKMLYLVNAEFRGQQVTKKRVLKSFVTNMQHGSLNAERHFGSFGFGHSLKWQRGFSQIDRDALFDKNVNLVCMHPGLGPMCYSHVVRENIHFINLVSMVTVVEHLMASLDSDSFRDGMLNHPARNWIDACIDDSIHWAMQHLLSARYISLKGVFNAYEYKKLDDGMSLSIGGLWVRIKIDQHLQVSVTYDQRTRAMVKDNYGDDFVYS